VEVAGETPVGPTILIAPWRKLARLALTQQDTVGFGGEQPMPPKHLQPSATFHLPRDVIGTFRSYKPAFSVQIRAGRPCSCSLKKTASLINSIALVHRLVSRRHTVGFKRVWMLGASEERIGCDT
jgi:hypothetical protein